MLSRQTTQSIHMYISFDTDKDCGLLKWQTCPLDREEAPWQTKSQLSCLQPRLVMSSGQDRR